MKPAPANAPKTEVTRVSSVLYRMADRVGSLFSRKAAQQIEHWANLGRTLEALPTVNLQRVRDALRAELDFDALTTEERAVHLAHLADIEAGRVAPPAHQTEDVPLYTRENGKLLRVYPDGRRVRVLDPLKSRQRSSQKSSSKTRRR
jgi:hypothetical protein